MPDSRPASDVAPLTLTNVTKTFRTRDRRRRLTVNAVDDVGGSAAAVAALLAEPALETAPAAADQPTSDTADTVNPLPDAG